MLTCTVLMYHYVRDAGDAADAGSGVRGLSVGEFCAQLDRLTRDYDMVTWDEVRGAMKGGAALPANPCLLTFDDGVRDHYLNVFPELRRRGLSGLFFALARQDGTMPLPFQLHFLLAHFGVERLRDAVWARLNASQRETYRTAEARYRLRWGDETDVFKSILQRELLESAASIVRDLLKRHVGDERELAAQLFLTDVQVREMRAGGMHFGGHSATHPWFDFVSVGQRAEEIRASGEWLRNVENAPFAFAYPYGGLADDAPRMLQANNFAAAFTTRAQTVNSDPFYLGRLDGEAWSVGNSLQY